MNAKLHELSKNITQARYEKMLRALSFRTRKITVVLEDIFQSHNAAAVMRNCDAFGVQDVHIIENKYLCTISRNVDMGASKWLSIKKYTSSEATLQKCGMPHKHIVSEIADKNTADCLKSLKSQGYALVASTLREGAMRLDEIPVDKPIALMIGTELTGLSDVAHNEADYQFALPMYGFAQSFNLSVFSALCLSDFTNRLRSSGDNWKLFEKESEEILIRWLENSAD